jgi:Subtilase family
MRWWLGGIALVMAAGSALAVAPAAEPSPTHAIDLAAQGRRLLWLRTGTVDVAAKPSALTRAAFEKKWHVLVLDGPLSAERRAALDGAGVRLGDYLPVNAVIADVSRSSPKQLAALGFVAWAGPYENAWRIDPALLAKDARAWKEPARVAIQRKGERYVSIWHVAGSRATVTLDTLSKIKGAKVTWQETVAGGQVVWAVLPQGAIASLSTLSDVQFVEEVGEFSTRSTTTTRWVVQSNVSNLTPLYSMGITGNGQLVNINDDPVGIQNCALLDAANPIGPLHRKIQAYSPSQGYSSHGTRVSSIVVGDTGANDDTRGIAYGARMTFGGLPFLTEPSITSLFTQHYNFGTRVSNNSWGDDGTTAYNGPCRALDAFCFANDDALMVFAISNQATIRNPENAKNPLAVGNSSNAPMQEAMCGGVVAVGPTSDGRRKPDLVAPGCSIIAASSMTGCGLSTSSGTSFAAPAVTGVVTLARQYFMDGFYPSGSAMPGDAFTPGGALLKAVVLNSAQDMTGVGGYPGTAEGWGRVQIASTLKVVGGTRRMVVREQRNAGSTLSTGATVETFIAVRSTSETLRVTLAFYDAPAAVNATFAAVNDLNLQVISPMGVVYNGNVMSGGVSVPGGVTDRANSAKQVILPNPMPGRWRVRVLAPVISQGPQGFGLVSSGVVDDVPCAADMDDGLGLGQPDQAVDVSDLLYFLSAFEIGANVADLDDGLNLGRPDGGVDISDLLYFLVRFEAGC